MIMGFYEDLFSQAVWREFAFNFLCWGWGVALMVIRYSLANIIGHVRGPDRMFLETKRGPPKGNKNLGLRGRVAMMGKF